MSKYNYNVSTESKLANNNTNRNQIRHTIYTWWSKEGISWARQQTVKPLNSTWTTRRPSLVMAGSVRSFSSPFCPKQKVFCIQNIRYLQHIKLKWINGSRKSDYEKVNPNNTNPPLVTKTVVNEVPWMNDKLFYTPDHWRL